MAKLKNARRLVTKGATTSGFLLAKSKFLFGGGETSVAKTTSSLDSLPETTVADCATSKKSPSVQFTFGNLKKHETTSRTAIPVAAIPAIPVDIDEKDGIESTTGVKNEISQLKFFVDDVNVVARKRGRNTIPKKDKAFTEQVNEHMIV